MSSVALAVALALGALPLGSGALGKVAVLDVQAAEGLEAPWLDVLSEVLTAELADSGRFSSVIASRDVKAMLSFEERRQILGCSDESCLAEIGGALGADRIVVCNLASVGKRFVLTLKLIDITAARTDARAYETITGGEHAVLEAMPRLVAELVGAPAPDSSPVTREATEVAPAGGGAPLVPIALFAVGAVGLGLGVGFGLDARAKHDTAVTAEELGSQRAIDAGKRSALLANVGYGVGATAVVAGALWWWLGSGEDEARSVAFAPALGPQGAGAVFGGTF